MSHKIEVDTKTFIRFWLVLIGLIAVALFIWKAAVGLIIIGAALFLAIALNPLVSKIDKHVPGKNRGLATAITYIGVITILSAILWVVIPAVVNETVKFAQDVPQMVEETTRGWDGIDNFGRSIGIENLHEQILVGLEDFANGFVENFGRNILTSVGAIGSTLAAIFLTVVLSLLMVMDGPRLVKSFWSRFGSHKRAPKAERALSRMAGVISKYVSGQLTVALINGCVTALAVFILTLAAGLDAGLALPFGLLTGTFSLIPLFGSLLGGLLVALLLAFSNVWVGLTYISFFIVYLQIESNIITPKIQSKGMRLPALVVLAAITIGIFMFGMIGAIIAIPIAGCIKVLVEEYLLTRRSPSQDIAK
jgi:predicted PurR-regulated permease PerM